MGTSFFKGKRSVLLILSGIICLSFIFFKKENKIFTLEEALQKKVLTASFISTGKYQGNSIEAKLKSKVNIALRVKIPAGTYFKAETGEEQDLVTVHDIVVQIAPQKELRRNLDGFCCMASNRCPVASHRFTLMPNRMKDFEKFTAFMKGKTYDHGTIQDAVWVISDQHSISTISTEDKEAGKALREHLSAITGLKNEWYEAPQNRTVDPYGNINPETVAIKGMIELDNKSVVNVHQEVQDQDGKVLMKTDHPARLEKGKVKYYFSLRVTGWEKGKYAVKLMDGQRALVTNEFEV